MPTPAAVSSSTARRPRTWSTVPAVFGAAAKPMGWVSSVPASSCALTPNIGIINDFSWNLVGGDHNDFGIVRSGVRFAF